MILLSQPELGRLPGHLAPDHVAEVEQVETVGLPQPGVRLNEVHGSVNVLKRVVETAQLFLEHGCPHVDVKESRLFRFRAQETNCFVDMRSPPIVVASVEGVSRLNITECGFDTGQERSNHLNLLAKDWLLKSASATGEAAAIDILDAAGTGGAARLAAAFLLARASVLAGGAGGVGGAGSGGAACDRRAECTAAEVLRLS